MATSCPKGYYLTNDRCVKSIHTTPDRKGTFRKGFEDLPQEEQYARIDKVARTEPPQELHRQISAMHSFSYRNPVRRKKLQKDLIYAKEKYPTPERRDPPRRFSYLSNDDKAERALKKERHSQGDARRKGRQENGGDTRMANGKCGAGEEFVQPYVKEDGTKVDGYCRTKHPDDSSADRREFSKMGKRNGRKARNWEDRRH